MKNKFTIFLSFIFLITFSPISYCHIQLGSDISGDAAGDQAGRATAISSDGNRIAVGIPFTDENGMDSGQVRVYEWQNNNWVQLGTNINGEGLGDKSGFSISLSSDGNRLAIGSPTNANNGMDSGHVQVYEWQNNNWVQLGINIDWEMSGDQVGFSVSLSSNGNRLAIGAPTNANNGINSGQVRIFEWQNNNWVQLGIEINGEMSGDFLGFSVSLSPDGNRLAIGAPYNGGNGIQSGHVRIYEWVNNSWEQVGEDIDGEALGDQSGFSVSLSSDGNRLLIGAPFNDGNGEDSGHVRIYEWDNNSWIQLGEDIDGEVDKDQFGRSVSISPDGNRFAVGAPRNDDNGSKSGQVRVYDWENSRWVQLGADIDGIAGEQLGRSVSLSSQGRVSIGAPINGDNGAKSGSVRGFSLVPTPGNECYNANDINYLFGQAINTPQTSGLIDNTYYFSNITDPTMGYDCFDDGGNQETTQTIWYSFIGDGNTYRIKTVECNATNYINNSVDIGNTQMAIYSGDCGSLTPVACNEDEDFDAQIFNANFTDFLAEGGVTYYIMIDGTSNSIGEFCLEVTLEQNTSIKNIKDSNITLYPNPTNGKVNLKNVDAKRLEIYDSVGRLVLNIQQPNSEIDVSSLTSGVYFFKIYTSDELLSTMLIKE